MLIATDQKVIDLLNAWQENDRMGFMHRGLTHITPDAKLARNRTKYIALDNGGSGHFMVNRETEQVYSIKGYGKPNLKKPRGTVEFLTKFIRQETAAGREYTHRYWYALHPTEGGLCQNCKKPEDTHSAGDKYCTRPFTGKKFEVKLA